jgi:hypothetical protein
MTSWFSHFRRISSPCLRSFYHAPGNFARGLSCHVRKNDDWSFHASSTTDFKHILEGREAE